MYSLEQNYCILETQSRVSGWDKQGPFPDNWVAEKSFAEHDTAEAQLVILFLYPCTSLFYLSFVLLQFLRLNKTQVESVQLGKSLDFPPRDRVKCGGLG